MTEYLFFRVAASLGFLRGGDPLCKHSFYWPRKDGKPCSLRKEIATVLATLCDHRNMAKRCPLKHFSSTSQFGNFCFRSTEIARRVVVWHCNAFKQHKIYRYDEIKLKLSFAFFLQWIYGSISSGDLEKNSFIGMAYGPPAKKQKIQNGESADVALQSNGKCVLLTVHLV